LENIPEAHATTWRQQLAADLSQLCSFNGDLKVTFVVKQGEN
jgi:hypothetical protein